MELLLSIILSYIAGSFPTAIIAGRIILKDDIRNYGSKNAGATNVFRIMGWKPAVGVLLVDIAKGAAAVLFISKIGFASEILDPVTVKILCGISAIAGHVWTLFAGFKGGKGVGTAFGVLLSLTPVPSLIAFLAWVIIVLVFRMVSLGSLTAGIVLPLVLIIQKYFLHSDVPYQLLILSIVLCVLIFVTHRSNIKRLINGQENKFGRSEKS